MAKILDNKELMNAIVSGFDPEVAGWLEKLVSRIPPDSPLRSKLVDRALGVAKSLIESQSERRGPVVGLVGEKLTDYLDFSRSGLFGKGPKKATEYVTGADLTAWMDRFFPYAEKRLAEADDPEQEKERLEKEFQARKDMFDILQEARKAAHAARAAEVTDVVESVASVDWNAKWDSVKAAASRLGDEYHRRDTQMADALTRFRQRLNERGVR